MEYRPRILDMVLDDLMPELPAIALDGPKGVGKTATASRRASRTWALDSESQRAIVAAEPSRVAGSGTTFIDEWQHVPTVWDVVRRAVDDGAQPASFLLAGSATPKPRAPIHSGAGRIVSLRMRPMALCERVGANPTVSLNALLRGEAGALRGDTPAGLDHYAHEIAASGLPGIHGLPERLRRMQLDGYLQRLASKGLRTEDDPVLRRPETLMSWLRSYASAESTTTTYEKIRNAAAIGDGTPPNRPTTLRYRDWLTSMWLLDPVPPWQPLGISLGALASSPRHQLADPALSLRLLSGSARSLLQGRDDVVLPGCAPLFGRLFEALATLTVRVCAQVSDAVVSHLRTKRGDHEIDLIVEGPERELLAIEAKLASAIGDDDVRHLDWLRGRLGSRLTDALVVTTGPAAYRRRDGIGVVPLALLGP